MIGHHQSRSRETLDTSCIGRHGEHLTVLVGLRNTGAKIPIIAYMGYEKYERGEIDASDVDSAPDRRTYDKVDRVFVSADEAAECVMELKEKARAGVLTEADIDEMAETIRERVLTALAVHTDTTDDVLKRLARRRRP